MQGHFLYLRFKTFPMTPRAHQCEVFWALLSNSKHSGVPEDSKSPTLEVLGFTPTLGQSGVATSTLYPFLELEAGSVPPSLNFPQLDFVEPSSGFHPVTWEHVNLGSHKTNFFTNNVSLRCFKTKPKATGKQLRWHDILVFMDIKLIHKSGKDNVIPNALSWKK
jgi:hypothetical protein